MTKHLKKGIVFHQHVSLLPVSLCLIEDKFKRTDNCSTFLLYSTDCFVESKFDQTVRKTIDTINCHQNNGDSVCTCVCCVCQQRICGKNTL